MELVNQDKVKCGGSLFLKDNSIGLFRNSRRWKSDLWDINIVSTVLSSTHLLYVCQLLNDIEKKS